MFSTSLRPLDENNDDPIVTSTSCNSSFDDNLNFPSFIIQNQYTPQLEKDGFVIFPHFFNEDIVSSLNHRLEFILRGQFDRSQRPDKTPRRVKAPFPNFITSKLQSESKCKNEQTSQDTLQETQNSYRRKPHHKKNNNIGPLGFSGNLENVKVMQVINVHKSDSLFRSIVTNRNLGRLIGELTGWDGVRLAQDQIWAKPPGAPPLVFHRDSPYFMFKPSNVVTVWLALDHMEEELGPLQYVKGSHKWGDGRVGTSQDFFQHDGGLDLLYSAARREQITNNNHNLNQEESVDDEKKQAETVLKFVSMAGLKAGGISIHDGRTWHGSGKNRSNCRPRRGLGIHYVPSHVRFNNEACKSLLWKKYVQGFREEELDTLEVPLVDFPIVWERKK